MAELMIRMGALADPIGKQLREQGFPHDKTKASRWTNDIRNLVGMKIRGILTERECSTAFDRIHHAIVTHVQDALGARSVATKERVPAKQNRAKRARRGPTASRRNAQTP